MSASCPPSFHRHPSPTERIPAIFRGADADAATKAAKAWAKANGLSVRTIASCRRRDDLLPWVTDAVTLPPDFRVEQLVAWEVVLIVKRPAGPLPTPPDLVTMPIWGQA